MMSTGMMLALIVAYAAISLAAAWERHWWRCLYFVGAIVISVAVLGMTWRRR
jgi:drug/metabolite transporter (DMT)-like permease